MVVKRKYGSIYKPISLSALWNDAEGTVYVWSRLIIKVK